MSIVPRAEGSITRAGPYTRNSKNISSKSFLKGVTSALDTFKGIKQGIGSVIPSSPPKAGPSTATTSITTADSSQTPSKSRPTDTIMPSVGEDDAMEQSTPDGAPAAAAPPSGSSGGSPGGSAGNAPGLIHGMGPSKLALHNPYDFLTTYTLTFTKTFEIVLDNANWITESGTTYSWRQFPYYNLLWNMLYWYLSPNEWRQVVGRKRYAKIKGVIFEIILKSHEQTFPVGAAQAAVAGNGNVGEFRVYEDQNQRYNFKNYVGVAPTGNVVGARVDINWHRLWLNYLYGTPLFIGDGNVAATDGPRHYRVRPATISKVLPATTRPAANGHRFNIWQSNHKTNATCVGRCTTRDIGAAYTKEYKCKNGLLTVAEPSNDDSPDTSAYFALTNSELDIYNTKSPANVAAHDSGTTTLGGVSGAYPTNYKKLLFNTDVNPNDTFEDYALGTIENYKVKSAQHNWPIMNDNPIFCGISPRIKDDSTLITGNTWLEIRTFMSIDCQEGNAWDANPLFNSLDAEAAKANWDAFKYFDSYCTNNTGPFLATGYAREGNMAYIHRGLPEIYYADNRQPNL